MDIYCVKHGWFKQRVAEHIDGDECDKCSREKRALNRRKSPKQYLIDFKEVHGDNYITLKIKYTFNSGYITPICPLHGVFKVRASKALEGVGCPICKSSKGENKIERFLNINDIEYIHQYKIEGYNYRYDFYLPDHNLLIEYDGRQHYEPVKHWGGVKSLKQNKINDLKKTTLAKNKGMKLLRIPYWKFKEIKSILNKTLKIDKVTT